VKRITIFGGTGFLGRRLVCCLARGGYLPRIAVRRPLPELFSDIETEQLRCDVGDPRAVAAALNGADGAVNAVGLYVENRAHRFHQVHVDAAREIAAQAVSGGLRLVHISGIGADPGAASSYIRARGQGEAAVRAAAPEAVILRPSALFGHDDGFLSSLTGLVEALPVIPLFGRGDTRLQPVHVDDVALAVARIFDLERPPANLFELGGPRSYC